MTNFIKKGLCLISVYAILLILVLLMSNRIMNLEKQDVYRNHNGSYALIK